MRFHSALVLGCGLALTGSIAAQPTPRPAQPPVQPGRSLPPQPSPYPPALYRMNDVSKTLNLSPDQINNLNKVTDQTQAQYRDKYNSIGTLPEAERFARTQELNRQYYSDWNKGAREVFNDTQRSRYQQFNYQYGGFNSLYDPDIQTSLGLTPAQVKDLREHSDWSNQQWELIHRMGATDPTTGTQMYGEYWKQRQERFNKFLTPEQQRAWSEMTGEPYRFQPSFGPPR